MSDLDISELARRSGVPASTLRYYEERGLIASVGRRGLKRLFDPSCLERLSLIALGQACGFSLGEIGAMVSGSGGPEIDKSALRAKAVILDQRIDELTRMRDGLNHAANCSAPTLMECPHFLRIVRLVGREAAANRPRRRFVAEAV